MKYFCTSLGTRLIFSRLIQSCYEWLMGEMQRERELHLPSHNQQPQILTDEVEWWEGLPTLLKLSVLSVSPTPFASLSLFLLCFVLRELLTSF